MSDTPKEGTSAQALQRKTASANAKAKAASRPAKAGSRPAKAASRPKTTAPSAALSKKTTTRKTAGKAKSAISKPKSTGRSRAARPSTRSGATGPSGSKGGRVAAEAAADLEQPAVQGEPEQEPPEAPGPREMGMGAGQSSSPADSTSPDDHLKAIEPMAEQLSEPNTFKDFVSQSIEHQPSLGWEKKLLEKWSQRKKKQ